MNFGDHVREVHARGALVVQPRMGMADPALMRAGLEAVERADADTVGTITLDSYTRTGDLESVRAALRDGVGLNGYPIVTYPAAVTRGVVAGLAERGFPVQVRHGSARPLHIFGALLDAGLHATEGGPVSYCLPYGRTPLDESVRNWEASCELAAEYAAERGVRPHLETFGGCMLGQLCPPSQLVAISVLEAVFFHGLGIRSLSLSYAQQTDAEQDAEAIRALRALAGQLLPDADWHVVVYAYMGVYPRTVAGANALLAAAARLAVDTGSERLIVKTSVESSRIPTVQHNVDALEYAAAVARDRRRQLAGPDAPPAAPADGTDSQVYREAAALVAAVLDGVGSGGVGGALVGAFKRGLLDVPYCLHPDNAGRSRSYLDEAGRLCWAELGGVPLQGIAPVRPGRRITSGDLTKALCHVQDRFDAVALDRGADRPVGAAEHEILEGKPA
ncbi:methylaspartate mutase [Kitasatospora phosalacinea]|uniref:Methylaspartate mutase n=1 Tax=Kitasatospora phosalacinea TaxID=2065 RepID=A0A9W6V3C8_9ACTN|nr:methylaspartate mutase [Kitasatospora phosalacinea]GLW72078.1 methylaspartate mutase [Kitasatospora phosalacinea]